jgi:serine phosphatase RsbU (regulator of sigma subunit)
LGSSQAIGLFDNLQVDEQTVHIPQDGVVLLYSDGLSEATDSADRQFGEERCRIVLRDLIHLEPQAIVRGYGKKLQRYCGESPNRMISHSW